MSTLLLRLAAPMQAWGVDSKFDTRTTQREPTKSGVLGMLAAALGIQREDAEPLRDLTGLRFGIRVDREGELLRDFHTARGVKSAYVTNRYYLSDAIFLVGLESDNKLQLEKYEYALTHPVYPLFLGRRACPPTLPLVLGVRDCDLEEALRTEPPQCENSEPTRLVMDAEADDRKAVVVKDVPVSFSSRKREYSYRKYREIILSAKPLTEHNPFAEVEAENVSDTAGT